MLPSINEEEENQEALVAPLLATSSSAGGNNTQYYRRNGKISVSSNSSNSSHSSINSVQGVAGSHELDLTEEDEGGATLQMMSTTGTSIGSSATNSVSLSRRLTDPRFCPPVIQGLLFRLLGLRSAADALPIPFSLVVSNGKIAGLVYLGANIALVLLWLPFWLLSFLLTEWGIYLAAVATVFLIGRGVIRFIAFPGASKKVPSDLEKEFAKYAFRMLLAALESVRETASCLLQACSARPDPMAKQILSPLWKRTETYRDRVLAVFVEILLVLNQQQSAESFQQTGSPLTKYGNNKILGDVGNLGSITSEARASGFELMQRLQELMPLIDSLGDAIKVYSEKGSIYADAIKKTQELVNVSSGIILFCNNSLRPHVGGAGSDDDDDDPVDAVRRQVEEGNGSMWDAAKSGLSSVQSMIDPHPHPSIFCMDFQRACLVSRFCGSRQLWIRRPAGGMIDVLHFPAKGIQNNKRAVLYCNPNAGLMEVSTGLSLVGGNVPAAVADPTAPRESWVDFYTELGFDVYLFNYAGYGRSYGTASCARGPEAGPNDRGLVAQISRIFSSCFLSFKPRPDTLRADGIAVAEHIIGTAGVAQLFIHGESIGGMTASGVAKYLTNRPSTQDKISLLLCDRTFCNLEAIAQRLVGQWTANAIRALTFYCWSTDVAGDFLASRCPKIVANDAADAIIADDASLKAGVALWKEIHRGLAPTGGIAWMRETPLRYRMADFENKSVNDGKYVASTFRHQVPVWPTDRHVSIDEALHFAACCKRIGKTATAIKRNTSLAGETLGLESEPLVMQTWKYLATCDGLVGSPLGSSVKNGFDATVSWLCSTLVFGGQIVSANAEKRLGVPLSGQQVQIEPSDFDQRPPGSSPENEDGIMHPTPIPETAVFLEEALDSGDSHVSELAHEYKFVIGTLRYIQARLSAPAVTHASSLQRNMKETEDNAVGSFLKLTCGHNNSFSQDEKAKLRDLIQVAMGLPSPP